MNKKNLLLALGVFLCTGWLSFAVGQEVSFKPKARHLGAPDKCVAFASWAGWGDFSKTKSATERWMAQEELVSAYKKVKTELIRSMEKGGQANQDESKIQIGSFKILIAALENSGFFYLKDLEIDQGKVEMKFHVSIQLKDQYEGVHAGNLALIKKIKEDAGELDLQKEKIKGRQFYSISVPNMKNRVFWSVSKGKLEVVSSESILDRWNLNKKTQDPSWLEKAVKKHRVQRVTSVTYVNIRKILQTFFPDQPPRAVERLGLDHCKELTLVGGLDQEGSVIKGSLGFDSSDIPILNFFPQQGFSPKDFAAVKRSNSYLTALKIDNRSVLDLVEIVAELTDGGKGLRRMFQQADQQEFDLNGVIESIGPKYVFKGKFVLPDPLMGIGFVADVNDQATFEKNFDRLAEIAGDQPDVEFENKDGIRTITFPRGPDRDTLILQKGDKLVIAFNKRKAKQFLKGKPQSDSIAKQPFLRPFFSKKHQANGRPSALIVVDPVPAIKVGYPILLGMGTGQKIPRTELSVNDLPPLDVVVKDWKPIVAAMYRTEQGVDFSLRTTTPLLPPPALLAGAGGVLLPAAQSARTAARRTASMNNIKQMALAVHMYHDDKGHFPAQYSTNKKGKPLLSWRVHILPYIGEGKLYEKFRLDEPWDSPHNKKLIREMPLFYSSPQSVAKVGNTNYLAISGEKAAFWKPKKDGTVAGNRIASFRDGTSNTAIFVESEEGVVWTAPRDFEFENKKAREKFLKGDRDQLLKFGFADGSVRAMVIPKKWEELVPFFTRDSGDN